MAKSDDEFRAAAREIHQQDGEIEIDEGAPVSRGSDCGAYVQAWVWVPDGEPSENYPDGVPPEDES